MLTLLDSVFVTRVKKQLLVESVTEERFFCYTGSLHLDALEDSQHFRIVGLRIDDRHTDDLSVLLCRAQRGQEPLRPFTGVNN